MGFVITIIAGLSTMIGIVPIFFKIKNIDKFLVSSLSFASGIMFSISTFDLLIESLKYFNKDYSVITSVMLFLLIFIGGILLSILIDKTIDKNDNLEKLGIVSMIGIVFHNIPEGILTYIAMEVNFKLGISLALAIMLHNIPEGISISIPIYYGTKSKFKAFLFTLISSLSEPFGALLAFLFFKNIYSDLLFAILLSIVCGIMIYISLFELLKEAKKYNEEKILNLFFIIGMLFMYITLHI